MPAHPIHAIQKQRQAAHGYRRLYLDDTPGLNIHQLRAKCARRHAQHLLSLVPVDCI
jgi:replicative DNA helicase